VDFSPQQIVALEKVEAWYHTSPNQVFRLFGYAGTGKTTIAKTIAAKFARTIERENKQGDLVPFSTVQYAAYTGKAALVMQRNGCKDARTLHSLAYIPEADLYELKINALKNELDRADTARQAEIQVQIKELLKQASQANLNFVLNEMSDLTATELLIIDECSMVDEAMALDILSFGVKVLVLGDPAQLPPVAGEGYFINVKPDVLLTEIHRQAEDNPIIKLASDVRNYKRLQVGTFGDSRVIKNPAKEERKNLALDADIIIVGKNATRRAYNKAIREAKGLPDRTPVKGDKVICLKNTADKKFINGAIFTIEELAFKKKKNRKTGVEEIDTSRYEMVLRPEGSKNVIKADGVHPYHFQGVALEKNGELSGLPQGTTEAEATDIQHDLRYAPYQFDFAYAITCHKSQGSQWDKVFIKDESSVFRDSSAKWIYTAITRAAKSVVVEI